MKVTEPLVGVPSYGELTTSDMNGAAAFYGGLFGWQVVPDKRAEAGGYAMVHLGEDIVAGMSPLYVEDQPPMWGMTVGVADADATVAAATQAGGSALMEPMDVFDYGRFAVISDPTGAALGLWQANTFAGASLLNADGAIVWVELNTRDPKSAVQFYTTVFGWSATASEASGMEYTQWGSEGKDFGGMMVMGEQFPPEVPPHWLLYFGVPDVDAAVAKATELGGRVVFGPHDIPATGRFAILADSQGAVFAVYRASK